MDLAGIKIKKVKERERTAEGAVGDIWPADGDAGLMMGSPEVRARVEAAVETLAPEEDP